MLISSLNQADLEGFVSRAFSLYLKGFGSRAVYFNGPLGAILHACYLYIYFPKLISNIDSESIYISLTNAHHRRATLLNKNVTTIDLRYHRKSAFKSLFTFNALVCLFQSIKVALKIRKYLCVFDSNNWLHILAAGFQVVAGIRLGKICAETKLKILIWGSDHCVVTRSAILVNDSAQKHHLMPHGPSIGKGNIARERAIFDEVYALNSFQKAVFLQWEPSLTIKLLGNTSSTQVAATKQRIKKPYFLFLNQLDLGLKAKDGFSRELETILSELDLDELLGVVVKDKKQLDKFNTRHNLSKQYLGVSQFMSIHPPGSVVCIVLSSGVSLDLMLAGYDMALTSNNALVEDEKARQLLGIPAPVSWRNSSTYYFKPDFHVLESVHAQSI
ncbi:hypothetical protein N9N21_05470 [Alphaproteobacteria bacterium]|jgi:hypothetical protein|nr:hypothetical protein [Alphaproteobacteria bacterium]